MTENPRVADLASVIGAFAGSAEHGKMLREFRKAAVAQSCAGDLALCLTCCETLDWLLKSPRRRGTPERRVIEQSLLANAVVLYARACSTGGGRGERGPIDIAARLEPHELLDHEALLRVRNRSLAHVYTREALDGVKWHDTAAFLVETPLGWKPGFGSDRVQFDRATLDRLVRQRPVAARLVLETFHRHSDKLIELINAAARDARLLEKHLIDPITLFGDENGWATALAGIDRGSAHGYH